MVARNYVIDKKPKNRIAEELGISRFKVARLIRAAVANGTVRIDIADPEGMNGKLSSKLPTTIVSDTKEPVV
jgi:DNA-binding transcriptional regulator LsrR (DeoR family)